MEASLTAAAERHLNRKYGGAVTKLRSDPGQSSLEPERPKPAAKSARTGHRFGRNRALQIWFSGQVLPYSGPPAVGRRELRPIRHIRGFSCSASPSYAGARLAPFFRRFLRRGAEDSSRRVSPSRSSRS